MKTKEELRTWIEDIKLGFPNACTMERLSTKIKTVQDVIDGNYNENDIKKLIKELESNVKESYSIGNTNLYKIEALEFCLKGYKRIKRTDISRYDIR